MAGGAALRLILVRHGQSQGNAAGLVQGQDQRFGLTDLGRIQVTQVADHLARHLAEEDPGLLARACLVSSDLQRCQETAQIVAERLGLEGPTLSPAWRERSFGQLEGRSWTSGSVRTEVGLAGGRVADPGRRPIDGESVLDLARRVTGWVGAWMEAAPRPVTVVVTHGGPMRVLWAHICRLPLSAMRWPSLPNAAVLGLVRAESSWRRENLGRIPDRHPIR